MPFAFLHRPRGLTTTGAKKSTLQDQPLASMTVTPSAVPAFFTSDECFAKSGWARLAVALSFGDKVAATDIVTISPPYLCIINPFLFCPAAKLVFFAPVSMPNDCASNEHVSSPPLAERFFFLFTVYHGCVRVVALTARLCMCVRVRVPARCVFVLPFKTWLCVLSSSCCQFG